MYRVPESALAYGFANDPVGTHGSRTIMLDELRLLLAACPHCGDLKSYRRVVVQDNALLKKTLSTRRESFRRLRELYALRPDVILFRAMRALWGGQQRCPAAPGAVVRGGTRPHSAGHGGSDPERA